MKKLLALFLSLALLAVLAACGTTNPPAGSTPPASPSAPTSPSTPAETGKTIKVGMICIGDENDQGYTYNFMRGVEKVTQDLAAEGITVEWVTKYNILENTGCEDACIELAEDGCELIILNSYGHENFMLKVAPNYPDIEFIACTNLGSSFSDLTNVHNAFANIFEGRYLAGVVAGMKLNELIEKGTITAEKAVIGYVGAYAYAEVVSGFTSFYLGARSVCPSVTMMVQYVSDWSNPTAEANAAQAMIDKGAVLISQHSDNTTPATTAQQNGVFHCGYNNDMTAVAPAASLISTRIDWSPYFAYAIRSVVEGKEFAKDWTAGMKEGSVVVTDLNTAIAAPGTAEKLAEVEAGLMNGTIHVFAGPFTGTGTAYGAPAPDTLTMKEGEFFTESDVAGGKTSAPYFYWIIDGITELNTGF